jgi:hypothetical protein
MTRLSNWILIVLALPFVVPICAVITDLILPSQSQKVLITEKYHHKGPCLLIFSDHTSANVSDEAYNNLYTNDSAYTRKTQIFRIIKSVQTLRSNELYTSFDSTLFIILSMMAIVPFVIASLHTYFKPDVSFLTNEEQGSIGIRLLYIGILLLFYLSVFIKVYPYA